MTQPAFFPDAAGFRAWLEANNATAPELSVGFRKKATGQPSITCERFAALTGAGRMTGAGGRAR